MKKVLGAVGGAFVAVWRWIKETAWVQPLLIVGLIFGIIFSIPSIVDGFRGISDRKNSPEAFYKKYQVSLKGAENSDAQNLFKDIYDELNEPGSTKLKGEKFLIAFVQGDSKCGACDSAQKGFEYLFENEKLLLRSGPEFKLKTIFTDEELKRRNKEDWKGEDTVEEDDKAKTAFEAFLTRNAVHNYLSEIAASAANAPYFDSAHFNLQDDILELLTSYNEFRTPTLIQVDFTGSVENAEPVAGRNEITAYFALDGETPRNLADYIADAWLYKGNFKV